MKDKKLTVSLSGFELDLLRELADHKDRSLSYMVGHAVEIMAYHGSTEFNGEWGNPVLPREVLRRVEEKHLGEAKKARE